MGRWHRGYLTVGLVAALAGTSGVVATVDWSRWVPLPEIATADREGVLRWLVLRDLAGESAETQRGVLARVEDVFREPVTSATVASLSTAQLEQIHRNAALLKRLWFASKVASYHATPAAEQAGYLDAQIATILRWAALDRVLAQESAARSSQASPDDLGKFLARFFHTLDEWREAAPEDERERMRLAVKAGLVRWLATQDLAETSSATRCELVHGLERQLADRLSLSGVSQGFSPAEGAQFWRNVDVLAEAWFLDKGRQYAKLERREQAAFVAQQLQVVQQLLSAPGSRAAKSLPVEKWLSQAPAADRAGLAQFAQQLQAAWMIEKIRSYIPQFLPTK